MICQWGEMQGQWRRERTTCEADAPLQAAAGGLAPADGEPASPPRSSRSTRGIDNFAVLGALRAVGYAGPMGVQGYSVGGDAYATLRHSLAALRDMARQLDAHPDWARLRAP